MNPPGFSTVERADEMPEGWSGMDEDHAVHYYRNGRSLCGRPHPVGLAVAGDLEGLDGGECLTCERIGYREVLAWYKEHPDGIYADAHDDGKVRHDPRASALGVALDQ